MDQKDLRELEYRCIQEEPPECQAACPLHIDVRAVIAAIRRGDWAAAGAALRKRMPLAGVLGRICDAPCMQRCKRGEVDDAICIGALERACVSRAGAGSRPQVLPSRGRSVAVLGGGLAGMTAAWDLVRKGYRVTVYTPEDDPREWLRRRDPLRLDPETVAAEIAALTDLGVTLAGALPPGEGEALTRCRTAHDAVVVDLAAWPDPAGVFPRDADGRLAADPVSRAVGPQGVFAGGDTDSFVGQAAAGRRAAASADRWLQGVSLTAGREKEGPFATRLFTSTRDAAPRAAASPADPTAGYGDAEALAEAGRCLLCECKECVKVCPYLERFGAYPKKYAREIYNNESIVMGERKANRLVNSCSLCGLCVEVCPEDFPMPGLCLQARRSMVQRGKMPPAAHEFALLDLAFSRSERFAMVRHQPGGSRSRYLFFPGCQLCASAPEQVEAAYAHLCAALTGGVGLALGCCGAPAHWSGQEADFAAGLKEWEMTWEEMGRPEVITACATCYRLFKDHAPRMAVRSLWPVLEETGLPGAAGGRAPVTLAVHDPCTTRHEPGIQAAVRRLLKRMNVAVAELPLSGAATDCCGFGGLMQNAAPAIAREVATRRSRLDPADYLATCAMCRDSLAAVGKRAVHLLDLIFPGARPGDPAARPRPGWSERQENRERLKSRLLATLWKEGPPAMEDHRSIRLLIPPEVGRLLEERRILEEDLQRVIHHAETSGQRWVRPDSGRLRAAWRPFRVTFWVEYEKAADGFLIHNAYCHRMQVVRESPP